MKCKVEIRIIMQNKSFYNQSMRKVLKKKSVPKFVILCKVKDEKRVKNRVTAKCKKYSEFRKN